MKVLIIGLGSIAKKHIAALKQINTYVEIIALRSSRNSISEKDIQDIYSLEDINSSELDFIIISSPTFKHEGDIKKCLALQKPLFIEKPFLMKQPTDGFLNLLEKHKPKTYTACNLRFLESIVFIKEFLSTEKPRINEANIYCGSDLRTWRPNTEYKNNYSAKAEMGGGAHLDLIHEIDYCYYLFGKPKSVKKTLTSNSTLKINAIDYANYCLEYENFCSSIVLNYYRPKPKRCLEIITNSDVFEVDLLKNNIKKNSDIIFSRNTNMIDTYKTQLEYFIDNINDNRPYMNNFKEAIEVLNICI